MSRPLRVTRLQPGDRVCLGDLEHGHRQSSDWSTDGLVAWCTVVDPDATPPARWNDDSLRLLVDGGCGGGDWFARDECVLLSYRPADSGGVLPDQEALYAETAAQLIREMAR